MYVFLQKIIEKLKQRLLPLWHRVSPYLNKITESIRAYRIQHKVQHWKKIYVY